MTKHYFRLFSLLIAPLAVIPIFAGWVGDITKDWLTKGFSIAEFWLFCMGVIGIVLLAVFILWTGRNFLGVANIEETKNVKPHRVVIALLSPCKNLKPPIGEDASSWCVEDTRNENNSVSLKGLSLSQVIDPAYCQPNGEPLPQWSWQQTLRAAHHHREKLKCLVLIGSEGGSGTKEQLDLAQQFFDHYFPGKVSIQGKSEHHGLPYDSHWQADFEKLDDLRRLLQRVLKRLHRDNYKDEDIVIDCTGGQKIASIACVLVTLDRPKLMFQYVGTGDRAGRITGFNVVNESRSG